MTTIVFKGKGGKEAAVYGQMETAGPIQFYRFSINHMPETLLFDRVEDWVTYCETRKKASEKSLKQNEPFLKTVILPDAGAPLYDRDGELAEHGFSDSSPFVARPTIARHSIPLIL